MLMQTSSTPSANRLHIGIFGKTNSGKSSFINALTGQEVSIVSDVRGTTTDPVHKAMEIPGLGACTLIDTAGFDDTTELGAAREEKTRLTADKCDMAVIVVSAEDNSDLKSEYKWAEYFKNKKTPVVFIVNKADAAADRARYLVTEIKFDLKMQEVIPVSSINETGLQEVMDTLVRLIPESFEERFITGDLVQQGDLVVLVMPQDIQAPKGRMILAQSQTIRELLDKKCLTCSVTTDQFVSMLEHLTEPPKLIITDSQVFDFVYENKPKESMLTSFSVLYAAYKGDLNYYMEGAKAIESLTEDSRVLIAECCTHAPVSEDIGRVKIPNLLRKKIGQGLTVDVVAGTDFPEDPSEYDLVIQCGGCMFNRKHIMSRIDRAKEHQVPMTNYGVTIAHLKGILDKIVHT